MSNNECEIFDRESVYDKEISPLMMQVIEICKSNGIPMIASFAYENNEDAGIGLCTTLINDIELRPIPCLTQARSALSSRASVMAIITKTDNGG